jgi:hypothetical protein
METVVEVTVIAGIILAITEILKTQANISGFWISIGVTAVIAIVAYFVPNGVGFLTILVALFSEVFGYEALKNFGILGRKKKVGGGGGSFRPR